MKAREPSYNPRASSGAMPVGAISRTAFIRAKHGAVQSCGGVRGGAGSELPAVQLPVLRHVGESLWPLRSRQHLLCRGVRGEVPARVAPSCRCALPAHMPWGPAPRRSAADLARAAPAKSDA
jgi:hypothetical protein